MSLLEKVLFICSTQSMFLVNVEKVDRALELLFYQEF